jgi:hypothetical protein
VNVYEFRISDIMMNVTNTFTHSHSNSKHCCSNVRLANVKNIKRFSVYSCDDPAEWATRSNSEMNNIIPVIY